jgi:hypothetical protein
MELLGMIFIIGFFIWMGATAVVIVMIILGIIGLFTLIPDNQRHMIKPGIGLVLIAGSLLLLISI